MRSSSVHRCIERRWSVQRYVSSDAAMSGTVFTSVTHPARGEIPSENERGNIFAVVGLGGTQFKVTEGDLIITNKLPNVDVGSSFDIDDVLLVGSRDKTVVGRPIVPGAKVTMVVEEQTKAKRLTVFKKIRRQGYKRTKGFRREITVSRVTGVDDGENL